MRIDGICYILVRYLLLSATLVKTGIIYSVKICELNRKVPKLQLTLMEG